MIQRFRLLYCLFFFVLHGFSIYVFNQLQSFLIHKKNTHDYTIFFRSFFDPYCRVDIFNWPMINCTLYVKQTVALRSLTINTHKRNLLKGITFSSQNHSAFKYPLLFTSDRFRNEINLKYFKTQPFHTQPTTINTKFTSFKTNHKTYFLKSKSPKNYCQVNIKMLKCIFLGGFGNNRCEDGWV